MSLILKFWLPVATAAGVLITAGSVLDQLSVLKAQVAQIQQADPAGTADRLNRDEAETAKHLGSIDDELKSIERLLYTIAGRSASASTGAGR